MNKLPQELQNQWIQAIKDCGQSLIDNAEEIAGHYDYQTSVYISMLLSPGEAAEISVDTSYLPKSKHGRPIILPTGSSYLFSDSETEAQR